MFNNKYKKSIRETVSDCPNYSVKNTKLFFKKS